MYPNPYVVVPFYTIKGTNRGGAHAMQYNKDEDVIKTSVFHLETV